MQQDHGGEDMSVELLSDEEVPALSEMQMVPREQEVNRPWNCSPMLC